MQAIFLHLCLPSGCSSALTHTHPWTTHAHAETAATAKASAASAESREAKSRNPSSFLLVPNQETLDKGEKRRRVGWVWLTGEKTTAAGRDGLLSGEGRAGVAAADHLYATAATEEMPSGRPTLGGVAVGAILRLLTRSAATAAAARASPRASPPPRTRVAAGIFPESSWSMFCSLCPQA
jgi:hypothetical protein